MKSEYFMLLMEVRDPNIMSTCIASPKLEGRGTPAVLRLDLSTVAVVPISTMVPASKVEMWKLGSQVSLSTGRSLDIFLKPKLRRSWSYVKEVSLDHDDKGWSKMRKRGFFEMVSIVALSWLRCSFPFWEIRWLCHYRKLFVWTRDWIVSVVKLYELVKVFSFTVIVQWESLILCRIPLWNIWFLSRRKVTFTLCWIHEGKV